MKIIFFLLTVTIPVLAFAQANDTVHHPAPKEPKFISAGLYDGFKSRLPNPPITNSAAQQSDEEFNATLQKVIDKIYNASVNKGSKTQAA